MNRILLVDDEPDIIQLFRLILEGQGFEVDCYSDPVQALTNYTQGLYDLVIIDYLMPGMDGFELYRKMRTIEKKKSKALFVTAFDINYKVIRERIQDLDPKNIITKPITGEYLIERVNQELTIKT
jgi:CheY-like chemotaxis protein